ELERGRAIAGGQSAEEKPYVEFRDTRAFGDEQRRDMGLDEGEDGDEGEDREGREGGERRGEAAPPPAAPEAAPGPRRERPGTGAWPRRDGPAGTRSGRGPGRGSGRGPREITGRTRPNTVHRILRMLRPAYPIETERLTLRPFSADDLEGLYAYQSLPEVARFLYWEPRTLEESRTFLRQKMMASTIEKEGDWLVLAVVWRQTGDLMGEVNLQWRSREHRQGEIGYIFNPAFHGKGFAT